MTDQQERIYIVYQDEDGGKSQHVIAKNRKEAWGKVSFHATHVSYRPWLKLKDGFAIDEHGKNYGSVK